MLDKALKKAWGKGVSPALLFFLLLFGGVDVGMEAGGLHGTKVSGVGEDMILSTGLFFGGGFEDCGKALFRSS